MTYEYKVIGEEIDFEPIEASSLTLAKRMIRETLAMESVWAGGIDPFTASVNLWAKGDPSKVESMEVKCCVRPQCADCGRTDKDALVQYPHNEWLCRDCDEARDEQ